MRARGSSNHSWDMVHVLLSIDVEVKRGKAGRVRSGDIVGSREGR